MKVLGVAFMVIAMASPAQGADGCGIGGHRGPGGGCYRNGGPVAVVRRHVFAGPAVVVVPPGRLCPIGYHLGRYGHRCFRN